MAVTTPTRQPLQVTVDRGTVVQWPIAGTLINTFGQDLNGAPNTGVNIAAPLDTDVRASADGTVFHVGQSDTRGNFVIIQHNENNFSVYSHLGAVTAAEGDAVTRNQAFATVGQSGNVTTPQLHFEMRIGTDRAPADPVIELGGPPPQPELKEHTVQANETMWKIAKEQYGLSSNADIQRAVEHLAQANGLSAGVDANHLSIGQVLRIPDASTIAAQSGQRLDWAALDADTRGAPIRVAGARFQQDSNGAERSYTIGRGGSLSHTIFEAARAEGITIDRARMNDIIGRVAEGNGIANANMVNANQQVHISRDMLTAAPA